MNKELILITPNIVLVFITGVYVFLTWQLVKETRQAREAERKAYIAVFPVPMGQAHAKVRIQNLGRGPALDIHATLELVGSSKEENTWDWPVLQPNEYEDFLIPTSNEQRSLTLRELAEMYEDLVVDIRWRSSFGKNEKSIFTFTLQNIVDGWYYSGRLIPTPSMDSSLHQIEKHLKKISRELETIRRRPEKEEMWRRFYADQTKHPVKRLIQKILRKK